MIREEEIERAVEWLRDNAREAAQAKANAAYLKEWVKSVRAKCALKHPSLSQVAADTQALNDPDYLAALEAMKQAVEADANYGFLREAADAKIRAWQTMCSNQRTEGRAYGQA